MNDFSKQKTTQNQLFQVFMDDFMSDLSIKVDYLKYRQNKLNEYKYLKTM
jgi:hypothetical protein